jgi:hypothetical protein
MKKIITLLAVIGMFGFQSCEGSEGPPGEDGLIAEVIEVKGSSFDANNGYRKRFDLNPEIYPGDMVLVYRLVAIENGVKVWTALPESDYYNDGSLFFNYNFEFTRFDVDIFIKGFELNTIPSNVRINQTFRIVIIPGDGENLTSKKVINLNDYNAVIKAYNIDDSNVKKLN